MGMQEKPWEPLKKKKDYDKPVFYKLIVYKRDMIPINRFTWKNNDDFRKVLELLRLKYKLQYR